MVHDDLLVGGPLGEILLGEVGVLAVQLEIIRGLVGGFAVDGFPFHEPDFLALGHHVVELVHLLQLYDLRDFQEGADRYVVVVAHLVQRLQLFAAFDCVVVDLLVGRGGLLLFFLLLAKG